MYLTIFPIPVPTWISISWIAVVSRSRIHCLLYQPPTQRLVHLKRRWHDFVHALSRPVPFGHAVPDLFAFGLDFFQQLVFVKTQVLAVIPQHYASDGPRNHRFHSIGSKEPLAIKVNHVVRSIRDPDFSLPRNFTDVLQETSTIEKCRHEHQACFAPGK